MTTPKPLYFLLLLFTLLQLESCGTKSVVNNTPYTGVLSADYQQIRNTQWRDSVIGKGMTWKYYHFQNLFSSKQFVSVTDIDLSRAKVQIDIPYVTRGFLKTSKAGTDNNAIAAVNGSYFDTKTGGSVVFFKKDHILIKDTKQGFTHYRENGAFALSEKNKPSIVKRPDTGWESANYKTLLTSGPLLIQDGIILEQEKTPFNLSRHPRTAIGMTANNHIISVVVDGRNAQSQGMNIEELSVLMRALGCVSALNLDGGGSSTMWIKNKGIVNHPSDNKLFDNEGERAVATVIVFK